MKYSEYLRHERMQDTQEFNSLFCHTDSGDDLKSNQKKQNEK